MASKGQGGNATGTGSGGDGSGSAAQATFTTTSSDRYEERIKDCDKAVEMGRQLQSDSKMIATDLTRKEISLVKMEKLSNDKDPVFKTFQKALPEHHNPDTLNKLNYAEEAKRLIEQHEYFEDSFYEISPDEEHEKHEKEEKTEDEFEIKMTSSSGQKKFEIEEIGNKASSQLRQPEGIQVEEMQLQASNQSLSANITEFPRLLLLPLLSKLWQRRIIKILLSIILTLSYFKENVSKQPRFRRLDTSSLEGRAFKLVEGEGEGFETITYMLQGGITHQDSAGHKGTIGPYDVQEDCIGTEIICVHCAPRSFFGVEDFLDDDNSRPYTYQKEKKSKNPNKHVSFKQRTVAYMEPFTLDVFISKRFVSASLTHRVTSKQVAVAGTNSKDIKAALKSRSDIPACLAIGRILADRAREADVYTASYTPRDRDKFEGKIRAVVQSLIDNGIDVKVYLD
ncbi:hypothetical protein SO802_000141 [Lithocarpus litseifolius]|uniref:Pirin N-terminal domain-containing protein n=1 Tax=Lithocarpus litseifolius TaxID=425828 RepID=A0AAW2DQU2_9ROSI